MIRHALILISVLNLVLVAGETGPPPGDSVVYTDWRTFRTADGLPSNRILAIHVQGERVWVGTDRGLALYENNEWKAWTADDGLPGPAVIAIDWDEATHDLWLGTFGGGLVRFTAGRFDRFDQFNSGLAGDQVYDVRVDGNLVWAATNGGVSAYDVRNDAWRLYLERKADGAQGPVTSLAGRTGRAGLFAAEWFKPVMAFDPRDSRWEAMPLPQTPDRAADRATAAVTLTEGGDLLVATQSSVHRRDASGQWSTQALSPPPSGKTMVYDVAARPDSVWVGTGEGLQVVPSDPGKPLFLYRACDVDGSVRMCVTQWHDGETIASRVLPPGLPDNRVRCIAFQGDHIWVGTENGLAVVSMPRPWKAVPEERGTSDSASTTAATRTSATPTHEDLETHPTRIAGARPITRMIRLPGASGVSQPARQSLDLAAVELAVDLANGGPRSPQAGGLEFVIGSHGYDRYAWGLPEDDWPGFALQKEVAGAVACIHRNDRYATAAVLAAGVPVLNIAITPPSADERLHPWIFRCPRYSAGAHRAVLRYSAEEVGRKRWALLRTPGELTAFHLDAWRDTAKASGGGVVADVPWDGAPAAIASVLTTIEQSGADAVLTWTDIDTAANILQAMRASGMAQLLVLGDAVGHGSYRRLAASGPPQIIATQLCAHPSPFVSAGAAAHRDGTGAKPVVSPLETFLERQPARSRARKGADARRRDALLSFEGTNHLTHASRVAGILPCHEQPCSSVQAQREALRTTLEMLQSATLFHWDDRQWRHIELHATTD